LLCQVRAHLTILGDLSAIQNAAAKFRNRGRGISSSLNTAWDLGVHRPALCIEEMNLNQQSPLHHSHEFMVQCVATGGPDMEFRWYKDDYLVDTRLADRYMKERFFSAFLAKWGTLCF
jgi:hypothetical protein